MKAVATGAAVVASMAVGMAAGAYLVMSKPCMRKIYRIGKRKAMKMLNM